MLTLFIFLFFLPNDVTDNLTLSNRFSIKIDSTPVNHKQVSKKCNQSIHTGDCNCCYLLVFCRKNRVFENEVAYNFVTLDL